MDRRLSARSACRLLGFSRPVACYGLRRPLKDAPRVAELVATSPQYPRFSDTCTDWWPRGSQTRIRRLWSQQGLMRARRRSRNRLAAS
jgi:hypothetical protein